MEICLITVSSISRMGPMNEARAGPGGSRTSESC
jgi:hypothetical protein